MVVQNLNFKSTDDNFKVAAFLIFNLYAKKWFFLGFFKNLLKNKKAATLKLLSIDLKLNFAIFTGLDSDFNLILKDENKNFSRISPWGISEENILFD